MHLKDVGEDRSAAMWGEETGIASSEATLGEGVNADSISQCLDIMIVTGREVVASPEAGGDVLTTSSVEWIRETLQAKGRAV